MIVVRDFISESVVVELEQEIKEKTDEIRRKYSLKFPDSVIAATAVVYGLTLISRNEKDFGRVKELAFVNPYQL